MHRRIAIVVMLVGTLVLAGEPARAATQNAKVSASVVKPLVLTATANLELGSITLKPGNWTAASISVSRTGVRTCTNPNVVCSGVARAAGYGVAGTNNQVVRISAPNVTLVNQSDPTRTIILALDAPATIALTNSGNPGTAFAVGGTLTVNSTTPDGLYSGTLNVTVDY